MILGRLAGPLRDFGFGAGLLYAAARVLNRLTPRVALFAYHIVVQPVPLAPTLPPRHANQIRFVELTPDAPELMAMPPSAEVKQARFNQGATALAVYRQDRYIGYIWFCFGSYGEDEVRCIYELPDTQSAFDFDVYVFPEFRLGRSFAGVWHAANEYLRARGVRRSYSRISRFNMASLRSHEQMGARRIGRATFLRLWRLQVMAATATRFSLRWDDEPRPVLKISRLAE